MITTLRLVYASGVIALLALSMWVSVRERTRR